ncbi:MAG: hypothetical protein Kow0054_04190 [Deferrisoma sp.]
MSRAITRILAVSAMQGRTVVISYPSIFGIEAPLGPGGPYNAGREWVGTGSDAEIQKVFRR